MKNVEIESLRRQMSNLYTQYFEALEDYRQKTNRFHVEQSFESFIRWIMTGRINE